VNRDYQYGDFQWRETMTADQVREFVRGALGEERVREIVREEMARHKSA
jgi:hypothetical protein